MPSARQTGHVTDMTVRSRDCGLASVKSNLGFVYPQPIRYRSIRPIEDAGRWPRNRTDIGDRIDTKQHDVHVVPDLTRRRSRSCPLARARLRTAHWVQLSGRKPSTNSVRACYGHDRIRPASAEIALGPGRRSTPRTKCVWWCGLRIEIPGDSPVCRLWPLHRQRRG